MPGSPTLRRAAPDDVHSLAELFLAVRAESAPRIPPIAHPPESVRPFLAHVGATDTVWVAEEGAPDVRMEWRPAPVSAGGSPR